MKKISILALSILFISLKGNCQITKGNWMIGGNATFSSNNVYTNGITTNKYIEIQFLPNVGYFFADKLAAGLKSDLYFNIDRTPLTIGGANGRASHYVFGPFARYYFLEQDDRINLFAEANYGYGIYRGGNTFSLSTSNAYSYSFYAGPVLYFNQSVGIEFTLGYYHFNEIKVDNSKNSIRLGLGLQIHLEKDK